MRIALAGDWFLPRRGGIEFQMRDLGARLSAKGHDVEILTAVPGPAEVDGLRVHRLGMPRLPRAGIVFTPAAFKRMAEQIEAGRYDVVHVHIGVIAPAAYGYAQVAQRLCLPVVATFHSVMKYFELPQRIVSGALGIPRWRVTWSAVSSVVASSVRPLVGRRPVEILPNGVDWSWWHPGDGMPASSVQRPVESGGLRVVSVMRLHRRKRPAALVRSVAEANRRLPESRRLHLEIIGDGREFNRLRRIIEEEESGSAVTLAGWKPREAVRRSLHQSDVFVMPSRLEGFGIAALEARCAGVPVVAMAASGARDFLQDGRDGMLVGSDTELIQSLLELSAEPGRLESMRLAARTPPVGFTWPEVVAAHERAYADAVG